MATTKRITMGKPEPRADTTKKESKDIVLPKQSLIFTGIGKYHDSGSAYRPLPRFQGGCKRC